MPIYQKAYPLSEVRRYPGWSAGARTDVLSALDDDAIVFVQEDLTVTADCFDSARVVFDAVTPEWRAYCHDVLGFAIPRWEEESARVREHLANSEKTE